MCLSISLIIITLTEVCLCHTLRVLPVLFFSVTCLVERKKKYYLYQVIVNQGLVLWSEVS